MNNDVVKLLDEGQSLLNLGNPKEAGIVYDKILSQEPNNIEALLKKGHILGKLARYQQAIIHYDKVLSQDNQNLLAWINKGLAHHFEKEYQIALDCYDKVLESKPNNTTTLYNKASTLVKMQNIKEGLIVLEKAIKLDFSIKAKAKQDLDFQEIKKLNEFKGITE